MQSFIFASVFLPILACATPLTLRSDSSGPVLTSSFTWNDKCGPTVACGPAMAGIKGQGTTAANNVTFAAGKEIVNGKGAGCGQCWHLQATADPFPTNGKTWGTPVVAIINDQCTDGGYCDQTETRPLNTGYGKQVHFDLCGETGTAQQFFGALGMGVLTGYAQQVDCSLLSNGPQGSGAGNLKPPTGGGSASATWKHAADGAPATSITASSATSNPTLSPWSNSTASQQNAGQGSSGQNNGGQSTDGQSSSGQSSSGQNSGSNPQTPNPITQTQQGGGSNTVFQAQPNQNPPQGPSNPKPPQTQPSPVGTQKEVHPQAQQQQQQQHPQQPQQSSTSTGHSHGSMKGLEDAAFKASGGGVQGMKHAMETYMQEALAGTAPDDDGEDEGDEGDECESE